MIPMGNWAAQAHEKLEKEKSAVSGQKERAMADAVLEIIELFCQQEPEFAQAVVQGQSFSECMKKVASGVGSSIKDLEAYKKAVQFYFPGATVNMQLKIDLIGADGERGEPDKLIPADLEPTEEKSKILTLDLSSFF